MNAPKRSGSSYFVGGAMGYLSAQQIKNEPSMCSLGYTHWFSGLSASLVFVGGIVGSIILGLVFIRIPGGQRQLLVAKLLLLPLVGLLVAMIFVMRIPNLTTVVVAVYSLMGLLSIG